MTQWIASGNGMPSEIRTESDTYVPAVGERAYNHQPLNSELNADFPYRLTAIEGELVNLQWLFGPTELMRSILSALTGWQVESVSAGVPFSAGVLTQYVTFQQLKQDAPLTFDRTPLQVQIDALSMTVAGITTPSMSGIVGLVDAMAGKVDVVSGKQLSTEDFTDALLTKLNGIQTGALGTTSVNALITSAIDGLVAGAPSALDTLNEIATQLALDESAVSALITTVGTKVDKVSGKGLSTEDYTSAEKTKLAGLSTARTTSMLTLNPVGTGATGTRISSTKDSTVRVTYSTQITYSLSGSPESKVVFKIAPTNDVTEGNWTVVGSTATRQPTGLSLTVGQVVGSEGQVCIDVPAGWYVKAVNSGSGTHTETFVSGQQTIYG